MTRKSSRLRRPLWRGLFEVLAGYFHDETTWHCMNFGFAPSEPADQTPELSPEDEPERYALNLYHHVASDAEVAGRDVLEVGCGRGGGSSYIARYLNPRRMVGIDISTRAIRVCQKAHHAPNLEYRHGDAEALPFPNATFDVVVNVESSFCYGDLGGFLAEVERVLRPGGDFRLADIRLADEVAELDEAIQRCGMDVVRRRDITQNVADALALDSDRRVASAEGRVPRPFRAWFHIFSGVDGTRIPTLLRSRELVYLSYSLQKREVVEPADMLSDLGSATTS